MTVFKLWFTALAVIVSAPGQSPAPRETYADLPGVRIWSYPGRTFDILGEARHF